MTCQEQRGWICAVPEDVDGSGVYSGWHEHGLCELHIKKD